MIPFFIDFVYVLSMVGILAGIALVVDGIRRLKEPTTTENWRPSGPHMTWIYWQKPARVRSKAPRT
jgi:hypothetical protein